MDVRLAPPKHGALLCRSRREDLLGGFQFSLDPPGRCGRLRHRGQALKTWGGRIKSELRESSAASAA